MHLRLLILKLLKESEKTGYDLIKIIEKETGWKPSPGSIYPVLNELAKKNLIKVREEGRKKIYILTSKGLNELNKIKTELTGIMDNLSKRLTVVDNLFGNKNKITEVIPFMIGQLKKGKIPFGALSKDLLEFKILLIKKMMDEKNHIKIKKIIKDATKQIQKI